MKEFTNKELKMLSSMPPSGYELSYYKEKIWCPTCKEKKPRREFVSYMGDGGSEYESIKNICNPCRRTDKVKEGKKSVYRGMIKHPDGPDDGSNYVKWLDSKTGGEGFLNCEGSGADIIHNDNGASNGLG